MMFLSGKEFLISFCAKFVSPRQCISVHWCDPVGIWFRLYIALADVLLSVPGAHASALGSVSPACVGSGRGAPDSPRCSQCRPAMAHCSTCVGRRLGCMINTGLHSDAPATGVGPVGEIIPPRSQIRGVANRHGTMMLTSPSSPARGLAGSGASAGTSAVMERGTRARTRVLAARVSPRSIGWMTTAGSLARHGQTMSVLSAWTYTARRCLTTHTVARVQVKGHGIGGRRCQTRMTNMWTRSRTP